LERMASQKKLSWDNALGQKEWSQPAGGPSHAEWNYDIMLDQPCALHSQAGAPPARHTTRECNWMGKVRKGDGFGPKQPVQAQKFRPPQFRKQQHWGPLRALTGANAQALPPQPRPETRPPPTQPPQPSQQPQPEINYVNSNNFNHHQPGYNPNQYRGYDETCVIFVTEYNDKKSKNRRMMEVNATIAAVPAYMPWSEQEVRWSLVDHPRIMPNPGSYALVVDPTIVGGSNHRWTQQERPIHQDPHRRRQQHQSDVSAHHGKGGHKPQHFIVNKDHLPRHCARSSLCADGPNQVGSCLWNPRKTAG
jgi:hypothetical protein